MSLIKQNPKYSFLTWVKKNTFNSAIISGIISAQRLKHGKDISKY
jgi:hypothetical protein